MLYDLLSQRILCNKALHSPLFFPVTEETRNTAVNIKKAVLAVFHSQQDTPEGSLEASVDQHLPLGKHPPKDGNQ